MVTFHHGRPVQRIEPLPMPFSLRSSLRKQSLIHGRPMPLTDSLSRTHGDAALDDATLPLPLASTPLAHFFGGTAAGGPLPFQLRRVAVSHGTPTGGRLNDILWRRLPKSVLGDRRPTSAASGARSQRGCPTTRVQSAALHSEWQPDSPLTAVTPTPPMQSPSLAIEAALRDRCHRTVPSDTAARMEVGRRALLDFGMCTNADVASLMHAVLTVFDEAVRLKQQDDSVARLAIRTAEAETARADAEAALEGAQRQIVSQRLEVDILNRRILAMEDHLQHLSLLHHIPLKTFRDRTPSEKSLTAATSGAVVGSERRIVPMSLIVAKNRARQAACQSTPHANSSTADPTADDAVATTVGGRVAAPEPVMSELFFSVKSDLLAAAVDLEGAPSDEDDEEPV